ncbi:hypothetical protein EAJ09_15775 [Bacteroides stercoris]|nr:hypothetical protein EAJ09_15775 [Bacteroides stercoris]
MKLLYKKDWRQDMMIKLYAINIVAGRIAWKDLIFSERVKAAIKEQIALMVDNEELLAELTKEKNIEEKG